MNNSIVILNFSPRNSGNCAKIAEFVRNYHEQSNVRIFQICAENYGPCGSCDYECLKPSAECPSRTEYQNEVMNSLMNCSLAYYVVPNFCGYPNANYFAFLERSVGYFQGNRQTMGAFRNLRKRFIIVSNTESEQFRHAMQQSSGEPEILYLKTSKYKKVSTAGDLLESKEASADLTAFLSMTP